MTPNTPQVSTQHVIHGLVVSPACACSRAGCKSTSSGVDPLCVFCALQISVGSHRFTYDNVYGSGGADSAVNLYPDCVQPLVDGLFKGYNATVFAYGEDSTNLCDNPTARASRGTSSRRNTTGTSWAAQAHRASCLTRPLWCCCVQAKRGQARPTPWGQHGLQMKTTRASYPASWMSCSHGSSMSLTQTSPSKSALWRFTRCACSRAALACRCLDASTSPKRWPAVAAEHAGDPYTALPRRAQLCST